jgi:hypothetical protein
MRGPRASQRQSHHLSAGVQLEPVRRAIDEPDLEPRAASAAWAQTQITTTPMHVGDICNLGVARVAPSSNRHLLDFISGGHRPARLRPHRLRRRQHDQQAEVREPDLGLLLQAQVTDEGPAVARAPTRGGKEARYGLQAAKFTLICQAPSGSALLFVKLA